MAYPTNCIIHSQIEANVSGEVISAIGNNGAIQGTIVFESAKFGNGARATSNSDGAIEYGNIEIQNKGCIELWAKAGYASGAGYAEWLWSLYIDNNNRILILLDLPNSQIYYLLICAGNVNQVVYSTSWNVNDLIHIAVTWDKDSGFDGTKTSAIYVNGVQVKSSTVAFNFGSTFPKFCNLAFYYNNILHNANRCISSLIDNIKAWNYPKTDFSDRFDEFGAKPRHQVIFI